MILTAWAARWSIPPAAIAELSHLLGAASQPATSNALPHSEAAVQNEVRMEHARRTKGRLFRNNVGAGMIDGRQLRWGLANDSSAVNKVVKSSDLIGLTPVVCRCGRTHGVFTSYECKHGGWLYSGTPREVAQLNWGNLVTTMGGIFKFVTSVEDMA